MLEIQKELDQFILTIKNTQVYKEYQLQKSKVKENPDLKRQLDQFRMRNYELQTKHCPDNLYDEMDCFQRDLLSRPGMSIKVERSFAICECRAGL